MRRRNVIAWMVLPGLLVVLAAAVFVVRTSGRDDHRIAAIAGAMHRQDLLLEARGWVADEAADLLGLDAFAAVPRELRRLAQDAATAPIGAERGVVMDDLVTTEALAAPLVRELAADGPVPPEVGRVLAPLLPATRTRLDSGDVKFLPPDDWVRAGRWLDAELTAAGDEADDASRLLGTLASAPPVWRTTEFVLLVVAATVVGLLGAVVCVGRVNRATRRLDRELGEASAHSSAASAEVERLRSLLDLGRRLSSDAQPGTIAPTIVAETCRLLEPDLCVLALVRDGRITPEACAGPVVPAAIGFRDGVVGRVAETGTPVRTTVPAEPMLAGAPGPLALVATPVTHDGRVAAVLLVARLLGRETGDEHAIRQRAEAAGADDESALGAIAAMSAGALAMANRLGTTMALALDDPLTGLGNRRRLDRDLDELRGRRRDDTAVGLVSFLMIDIDHFKAYNDTYGHPAGDALLRSVGGAIASAIRVGDVAYRFGGEEFSVLLADTDVATATRIAERVRTAVSRIVPPAGAPPVTVSIGVSSAPTSGSDRLVGGADEALYASKRAGRDRVTVVDLPADGPLTEPPPEA